MNFKRISLLAVMLVLGSGFALRVSEPEQEAGAGPVPVHVLAGGYRHLVADWLWLQADLAWERHDAAATRRWLRLTVSADPHSSYFWLNGARMLAHDVPAWGEHAEPDAPEAVRRQRRELAAQEALQWLDQSRSWHAESPAIWIEMGNIHLYALGDRARASECFREASRRPGAPAYAARLHARLNEAR